MSKIKDFDTYIDENKSHPLPYEIIKHSDKHSGVAEPISVAKSIEDLSDGYHTFKQLYDFMKEVNNMINESREMKYSVKQAIYIIENLYRLHEENKVNELTPKWAAALKESMNTLRNAKKTQDIMDYIEYGEYLLSDMQVLRLNSITVR